MGTLTYKYLGDRDLDDAKVLLRYGSASMAGRLIHQAIEKNLKQLIEDNGDTNDLPLFSIHNTIKLYDKAVEIGGVNYNKEGAC